jgi:hypothetical protein
VPLWQLPTPSRRVYADRMGHNSGARPERMRIALLQAREAAARDAEAVTIVERWNAELAAARRPLWSPTIEAEFRARRPWLRKSRKRLIEQQTEGRIVLL